MKRIALLSTTTLIATIASSGAYALSNRTFVSGTGSDSNPCSLAAPCRSFAGALAQTSPGGEIAVLDTAGYGTVTITQAVSIVNEEGVEAGITVTSGDGITINAAPFDVVNLRGLTLVGAGGSVNGITFNSGAALNIQNCVIRGFSAGQGLNLVPTGNTDINVSNTIVLGNSDGVYLQPSGTNLTVTASFEQVQAIHNHFAGFVLFGSTMTGSLLAIAADSLASGNGTGFQSLSAFAKATTTFTLANSKAANNANGVDSDGNNAGIILNGSTISGNSFNGFSAAGGAVIASYGNNAIVDATNIGTLTPASLR
jgi:hypothetical protein